MDLQKGKTKKLKGGEENLGLFTLQEICLQATGVLQGAQYLLAQHVGHRSR